MSGPVGVKWVLSFFFIGQSSCTESPLSPPFHPQSLMSILLAAIWVFSVQSVLQPVRRPFLHCLEWKLGQALDAVTGIRRFFGPCLSSLRMLLFLRGDRHCDPVAAVLCHGSYTLRSPTSDAARPQLFAVAMMARFFPFLPPRSASFSPQPRRSQRGQRSQNVLRAFAPAKFADRDRLFC